MVNKKVKFLIITILLSLSIVNISCNKPKDSSSNKKSEVKHNKDVSEKKEEQFANVKIEDITKLFSTDKYGFVFEKIELDNKETHYIGKCKDPECFGLIDINGNDKLDFLKYSMALSEDEKINNNSFEKMESLINIICPSFKDFSNWLQEAKNNIKATKGAKTTKANYNGMNISFGEDENTGAWFLSILKDNNNKDNI